MSEENWFWEESGERKGPGTAEQVKGLREAGTISDTTLVWCDGMADWAPFSSTPLSEREADRPPAIPPALTTVRSADEPVAREVALRAGYRPQFRSSLSRAWQLLTSDFWPFVGMSALVSIILSVAMQFYIPMLFLMYPLMIGFSWYVLKRKRGLSASIDDAFVGFKSSFKDLALINLILSIPMVILVVLFVIGIIASGFLASASEVSSLSWLGVALIIFLSVFSTIVYCLVYALANFACLLAVDCAADWRTSLKFAWEATKPHWFKLSLMGLAVMVIAFSGMIALYFGVFVTVTWTWMAMVYWYEDAFGDDEKGSGK